MSALGDYIHRSVANYDRYGIGKEGKKGVDFSSALNAQHRQFQNQVNSINKEIDKSVFDELRKRIFENFPEGKDRGEVAALEATKTADLAGKFQRYIDQHIKEATNAKLTQFSSANMTANEVKDIDQIAKAMAARRRILENIQRINAQQPINEKSIKTLLRNLEQYFEMLGLMSNTFTEQDLKNKGLLSALEKVIKDVSFASLEKATLHGQWGEQTVALCGDVIQTSAEKAADEAINSAVVGVQGTSFQRKTSTFNSGVANIIAETKLTFFSAKKSQDKVDVELTVKEQPLKASVKAYTASKTGRINATLQHINLLDSLSTANRDFANHWLNIHAAKRSNAEADAALENHMKYEALVSGNLLKQGASKADTFIAIDVASGKSFVATTYDILTNESIGKFNFNPKIGAIKLAHQIRTAKSPEERIAKLLLDTHTIKVHAGLSVKIPK